MSAAAPVSGRYRAFAWAFLAYTVGVAVWGAYVRATGSGAGCGEHWPLCNGVVLPRAPTVETLVELAHRVTSGLLWASSLVGLLWARRAAPAGHPVRRGAWAVFIFTSSEGFVGAALVLGGLVAGDASYARGAVMAVHLVNTFLLLAAAAWTAYAAGAPLDGAAREGAPRWLFGLAVAALIVVGISGAVTALGDTLFPVGSLDEALRQDRSPTAHLFVQLRVLHPVLGLTSAAAVVAFAGWIAGASANRRARVHAASLIALLAAQVGIGFLNVALLAPVWLQLGHLFVADLVWVTLVLLGARVLTTTRPADEAASRVASGEPSPGIN